MTTTLRRFAFVLGAMGAVALTAGGARADNADAVAGRFEVKYEEVTSNCENTGMSMLRGVFEIEKKKAATVAVDIERMPLMQGSAAKGGRVKATSKLGPTSIQGLDGRFSVAGTVNDDGVLQMVLVAEYYLNKKPYCTQSWNVSGVRAGDAPAPKAKKTDAATGIFGFAF
ncbi:MAG TPA: hypothetical protein VM261_38345 [Kofleriaceae bacterium]|nr:hypothetical protein [Kofleriaceae bacterium]